MLADQLFPAIPQALAGLAIDIKNGGMIVKQEERVGCVIRKSAEARFARTERRPQVDMIFDNIPGSLALAVTSRQRSPAAPGIPAMAEFLRDFDVTSWGGICGPAGLPPAMIEKLSRFPS
jgi:hypothetical protein